MFTFTPGSRIRASVHPNSRDQYLPFRQAYDLYKTMVRRPVMEGAVRRWINQGKVPGFKRGSRWLFCVQDLVRHHVNKLGQGLSGKKAKARTIRISPVADRQLEPHEWEPHVREFLKGRAVVRPRQICDLVGVPQDKLGPEVRCQMDQVKQLLQRLGWKRMPEPKSYDWCPVAVVRKAKAKKRAPARTQKQIEQQKRQLVRLLKRGGAYTADELAEKMKLTRTQLQRRILRPLVKDGRVLYMGAQLYYHP